MSELPFTPDGVILATPAVDVALVDGILAARLADALAEIGRLALALRAAQAAGDDGAAGELAASLAYARSQRGALTRAIKALTLAAHGRATLAAQTLGGAWMVVGSEGTPYHVERHGMQLVCSCPHGERVASGEAAAGVCWHAGALVPAIEEAQDAGGAAAHFWDGTGNDGQDGVWVARPADTFDGIDDAAYTEALALAA